MKTYSFKLYTSNRNKHLHQQINLACEIYNHCIALHKRYYRLYGKYPHVHGIQKHITKLKKLTKYNHWKRLNSQAIQDITQRIDRADIIGNKEILLIAHSPCVYSIYSVS